MSTDKILRFEYRNHLVEITLSEDRDRRWQGDWAVFNREPFAAVGAGLLAVPGDSRATAQAAAWRGATKWVDHYVTVSAGA